MIGKVKFSLLLCIWILIGQGSSQRGGSFDDGYPAQSLDNQESLARCNPVICNSIRTPCSSNLDCECFPLSDDDEVAGICAAATFSCSSFVRCNVDNITCSIQNTVCVTNTRCDHPVCYPLALADKQICPDRTNPAESNITTTTQSPSTTTTAQNISGSRTVLLLSDNQSVKVQNLVRQLQMNGLNVNYIPDGIVTYSGTPIASSFDVIILITGDQYTKDMPAPGQQSIVNAQQLNSTAVVMTEWAAYQVLENRWQFLSRLLLAKRVGGITANITFSLALNSHPIWKDLPITFISKVSMSISQLNSVSNGAQTVAYVTGSGQGGPGVIVKSENGTAGRLVQIAHSAHHTKNGGIFNWMNDNNISVMMVNAVRWAAKLI